MRILLVAVGFFSLSGYCIDLEQGLPNGHFAGHGNWTDNAYNSGEYSTYVEFQNNDMRVDYAWGGQSLTIFLSFWFHGRGEFDVIYQGDVAGHGFCHDDRCYYELDTPQLLYAETLIFSHDENGAPTLSKIGHKRIGNRTVQWQDGLFYVNLGESDPVILPIPEAVKMAQKLRICSRI